VSVSLCACVLAAVLQDPCQLPGRAYASPLDGVGVNKPFQVVRPTDNHTSLVVLQEGLHWLQQHDRPIALVPVVGPYHSGKSFLLNSLANDMKAFSVGPKTTPETMGIWLCRTSLTASDGSEVWLMDSEGFFGPGVAGVYDAKIFTIASLLGAHLVYNTVKVIDQQAVVLLEMLARQAQLFRTRSNASNAEVPEFLSTRNFPPFTWVVEDFVQELPETWRGMEDGATAWLKTYLTKVEREEETSESGTDKTDHFLTRLYQDIRVHTLFWPSTSRAALQDLSQTDWADLTPEFRQELTALKKHITTRLKARVFKDKPMTGRELAKTLHFIVQALEHGFFPALPSLWSSWTHQVSKMSMTDAESWFESLVSAIDGGASPIPVGQFNEKTEAARLRAISFYTDLLRDFDVPPRIRDLRKRLAVHSERAASRYHERIQHWVNELIEQGKSRFQAILAALVLPMDPKDLDRQGFESSVLARAKLSEQLSAFADPGRALKEGKAVRMPDFLQAPPARLSSDLQAMLGAKALENDKEIQQNFKAAFVLAEGAVEVELKANSERLMGDAAMRDLRKVVDIKCWSAFEDRLSDHKWMKTTITYRQGKARVQKEALENRLNRFEAANWQRIASHLKTARDRIEGNYKIKKNNLPLPAHEENLEAEHRQVADSCREGLEDQASGLTDSEPYARALKSLNKVLAEGYAQVRTKNIDLWKAYSDEATRCALDMNKREEQKCGLFSTFNKIPWSHKRYSKGHLYECFSRFSESKRMTPSMQDHVFVSWYTHDLAGDAYKVRNQFFMLIVTCVVVVGGLFFWNQNQQPRYGGGGW